MQLCSSHYNIIIIMWLVWWWTLPFLRVCSRLVDSGLDDRQLPDKCRVVIDRIQWSEPGVMRSAQLVVPDPCQRGHTGPKSSTVVHGWIGMCNDDRRTWGRCKGRPNFVFGTESVDWSTLDIHSVSAKSSHAIFSEFSASAAALRISAKNKAY